MRIKMMTRRLSDFRRNRSGIAAMEFALVAPIVILFFFGVIEATDAYIANKKVQEAADIMSNLVSLQTTMDYNDMEGVISAGTQMLDPYGIEGATVEIVSVVLDGDGDPVVAWSLDKNRAAVYTAGADYTSLNGKVTLTGTNGIMETGSALIVTKITFPFTSSLGTMTFDELTFETYGLAWPRSIVDVEYCDNGGTCFSKAAL